MSFGPIPLLSLVTDPIAILSFVIVILFGYIVYLDRKVTHLTRGKSGASLEDTIEKCIESVKKIEERNELISAHALTLQEKMSHAIRNVSTIRYKAFDQNGSNQSFSIALVNEEGNGAVISSLHAHERNNTFAKPVQNYTSTYELTEEEEQVLKEAKDAHKETKKIKS